MKIISLFKTNAFKILLKIDPLQVLFSPKKVDSTKLKNNHILDQIFTQNKKKNLSPYPTLYLCQKYKGVKGPSVQQPKLIFKDKTTRLSKKKYKISTKENN